MSPISYFDDPSPVDANNDYVELADLKSTLSLTSSYADADLALAITAASRGIDKLANRRFWPDADAEQVRYYTPDSARFLRVDDLIEVTSIKTDPSGDGSFTDHWTLNTDFYLSPLNAVADGEPWSEITVHPLSSFYLPCSFPRSVEVTGKFGWAEAPFAIKTATVVLATRLMNRTRESPMGVIALGDMGIVSRIARTDPDVAFLVGPFIRGRVTVA